MKDIYERRFEVQQKDYLFKNIFIMIFYILDKMNNTFNDEEN